MKTIWYRWGAIVLLSAVLPGVAAADEGKVSGYMFGDYYYLARASGRSIGAVKGAKKEKNNGFALRRIYFQYDRKLEKGFSIRLRFEANDAGFGSGSKMIPFVKHAYLKYSKSGKAVYMGLSGTPTWSVSEKVWGYRSIEKTVMDLHKIGSSADLGVAFSGNLDGAGRVKATLMFGNGPGQKPERDDHKKIYAQLAGKLSEGLTLVGYADWEGRPADKDRLTAAGFLGLQQDQFTGGVEGFMRINKNANGTSDVKVRGISVFGSARASARAKVFGRVDVFDPSDKGGDDVEYLVIGGVDFIPAKGIHMMPNLWVQAYQAPGVDADVVPRVTVYYKF